MAWFMDFILVFVFVMGSVVSGDNELEIDKDDNIEPFSLLCRIYNVAKNPPINHVDLQDPNKIVKEIEALNASLVEPKLPNETEQMGNSVGAKIPHTTTQEAALAQLSLNQITQRAHKVLDEIKKINVEEKIEEAKADFSRVIFGENGNESDLEHTVLNGVGDRAAECGNTGRGIKGDSAGKNLVVDFFCLCARRADTDGVNQVCGFFVGVKNSQIGWSETQSPLGPSTMWASIKGGCGKHMQQRPKSTVEARHILDQFLKHLETGGVYRQIKCQPDCPGRGKSAIVEGSDRKAGILGTGVTINGSTDVTCDGKKGNDKKPEAGGVCVYYGPGSWKENILWLEQFQTALTTVDTVKNQKATIQRSIQKLQMLLHRAEEIYETAKVVTEIQNPIGLPTAFQNTSGNLSVYNATRIRSYSHSLHAYLIPPWVLLIL